ncbi:outer membrane lipoprotein-sorting protein [Catenovulum sp. SM1970]|uniref:outer membrane lipoprotein-sorting protein n=1 Tax=Marinifaba aquimaris TaxID=2741323 RepID=UPI0015748F54|nr:outer membrane lipoprotein-sorting protein [Marinifaba aquimaris]NTS76835.1 outer membrane lipoprotein-sorting protein [Marinifaba aquimaris]
MPLFKFKTKRISTYLTAGLLTAALAPFAQAQTPEEKGLEIAKTRKATDRGWNNSEQDMKMILRNAQGNESVREMRSRALEITNDGDKGLTIFDKPRDVKGTAFLSFSHTLEPDDQWLYLPALKRVKRISSRNKSGPFMGSEFAYEDMSSFEVEKYDYKFLRDEACPVQPELTCYVVESNPKDKFSGYSKTIVWIDHKEYRMFKAEYYDKKKDLLKTLESSEYKLYLDKYWRAHKLSMVNHQTGKSTVLLTDNIRFNTGLTDKDFDKNTLKRIR